MADVYNDAARPRLPIAKCLAYPLEQLFSSAPGTTASSCCCQPRVGRAGSAGLPADRVVPGVPVEHAWQPLELWPRRTRRSWRQGPGRREGAGAPGGAQARPVRPRGVRRARGAARGGPDELRPERDAERGGRQGVGVGPARRVGVGTIATTRRCHGHSRQRRGGPPRHRAPPGRGPAAFHGPRRDDARGIGDGARTAGHARGRLAHPRRAARPRVPPALLRRRPRGRHRALGAVRRGGDRRPRLRPAPGTRHPGVERPCQRHPHRRVRPLLGARPIPRGRSPPGHPARPRLASGPVPGGLRHHMARDRGGQHRVAGGHAPAPSAPPCSASGARPRAPSPSTRCSPPTTWPTTSPGRT